MSKWSQKSFLRISENYTFENVILESVGVDAHCHTFSIEVTNIFEQNNQPTKKSNFPYLG